MKPIKDILSQRSFTPVDDPTQDVPISPRDNDVCPICGGIGYLRYDVPLGHPSFGKIYPCECKEREQEARRADELRKLSNLQTIEGMTFQDFEPETPGVQAAYEAAMEFALQPDGHWLVLSGPCGVGKTHLAIAICRHAIDNHHMSVYFAVVPDLLDHLRATFDPDTAAPYDDRFTTIRNAPLLVLDDLGTENATPWAREKLYQIINHRYSERLPTIITTNVDFRRIDERIVSRMLDTRLTTHVDIDAEDFRRPGGTRRVRGRTSPKMRY